jgi:hypothetical protein
MPIRQQFTGPGIVDVLNNGTIIVYKTQRFDPGTEDVLILPPKARADKLGLIETDNATFIGSVQGRYPGQQKVTAFEEKVDGKTPEALLSVTGNLEITFLGIHPKPFLDVVITADDGTVFKHRRQLVKAESPLNPSFPEEEAVEGGVALASTCSASCTNGSGSITCGGNQGCYAYCNKAGNVKIGCGSAV